MSSILTTPPPQFTEADAARIARDLFGIDAASATNLGSERDQTFGITGADGARLAILKVSNAAEDPDVLDMEEQAVHHITRVDPELLVPVPWEVPGAPGTYRAPLDSAQGRHWVRAYSVIEGASRIAAHELSDAALVDWGRTCGRLGRATRGFMHSHAQRTMLWDIQHALATRPMLEHIQDPEHRALAAAALDRFDEVVVPVWPSLRGQVIHGDLTVDNAISDDRGFVIGVIDFGDMAYSALVADLATAVENLCTGREGEEVFRAARLVLDGYQRVLPIEAEELAILAELVAARAAITIAISSWRAAEGLEDREFAERYNERGAMILRSIREVGWEGARRRLGGVVPEQETGALAERRRSAFGSAIEPLSYAAPLHVASAEGVWITDTSGRQHLDAYNNVPCVGHTHPRVTEAIARQARRINTHLRYLSEPAVELAERLVATCPPGLDTVLYVNSGTEANDLAWRLAKAATGHTGFVCTDFAYHGISEAIAAVSPEGWYDGVKPDHVETWLPPDRLREKHLDGAEFAKAVAALEGRGHQLAATILDGVLTSDGVADLDAAYVQDLFDQTRAAGALWIADEVQAGHWRTGEAIWSFQRFGIEPDFVTIGKPMGNGHPVAALITRSEIIDVMAERTVLFSTFGGNPVSAAAGLAVLDVLEDERVGERVRAAGISLRENVSRVLRERGVAADVRGVGLAIGVELVISASDRTPHPHLAKALRDALREHGVLVGTTGRHSNVLKIRPPLAFTTEHVPIFMERLNSALDDLTPMLVSG